MPNKIYTAPETEITFMNTGGTVAFNLRNLAAATGRLSTRYDKGSASRASLYRVLVKLEKGVAGVVGNAIPIYIARSDGTYIEGNLSATDGALTAAQAEALMFVGVVPITFTTTNTPIVKIFENVPIVSRHYSVGLINSTGLLRDTDGSSFISVGPMPDEIQ